MIVMSLGFTFPNQGKLGRGDPPGVAIDAQQGIFFIAEDVIRGLERAANETIPPCGRDEKVASVSVMKCMS